MTDIPAKARTAANIWFAAWSRSTTKIRSAIGSINTPWAVLIGALLVALAVLASARGSTYMPNPQGGLWVRAPEGMHLCSAAIDKPAPCVSLRTGTVTSYDKLGLAD